MRVLAPIRLTVQLAGCTVADLDAFAPADGAAPGAGLARALQAALGCVVTSTKGDPVVDRRGDSVLCEP